MGKKKNNIGFLTAVALTGIFVVAAIMFVMTQCEIKGLLKWAEFNGFSIAFGKDNSDGTLYFGLIFFFSVLAAVVACLNALKVIKVKPNLLFAVCAILALGSIIVYLAFFFDITGGLKNDNLGIDLSDLIKWTFAYWFGFVLQIIAFGGSVFAVLKAK